MKGLVEGYWRRLLVRGFSLILTSSTGFFSSFGSSFASTFSGTTGAALFLFASAGSIKSSSAGFCKLIEEHLYRK